MRRTDGRSPAGIGVLIRCLQGFCHSGGVCFALCLVFDDVAAGIFRVAHIAQIYICQAPVSDGGGGCEALLAVQGEDDEEVFAGEEVLQGAGAGAIAGVSTGVGIEVVSASVVLRQGGEGDGGEGDAVGAGGEGGAAVAQGDGEDVRFLRGGVGGRQVGGYAEGLLGAAGGAAGVPGCGLGVGVPGGDGVDGEGRVVDVFTGVGIACGEAGVGTTGLCVRGVGGNECVPKAGGDGAGL